ncbi:hypothetical protein ABTP01_19435, partial [Acinetobacter baumannii]
PGLWLRAPVGWPREDLFGDWRRYHRQDISAAASWRSRSGVCPACADGLISRADERGHPGGRG